MSYRYLKGDEEGGFDSSKHSHSIQGIARNQCSPFLILWRRVSLRSILLFISILSILIYFIHSLSSTIQYPGPKIKLTEKFRETEYLDPSLPIYRLPNGTRYPKPLPPSDKDPFLNNPTISPLLLKSSRQVIEISNFKVPKEHFEASMKWFGETRQKTFNPRNEVRGEGIDAMTGRPLMIDRKDIYLGKQKVGDTVNLLGPVKVLPRVQIDLEDLKNDEEHRQEDEIRKEWVRKAFLHLWNNYKKNAWGNDELRPMTSSSDNKFNGWGATILDALDTLLIMDLKDDYLLAREHVKTLDFTYLTPVDPSQFPKPSKKNLPPLEVFESDINKPLSRMITSPTTVPTFETVIRYLGALISAFDLSGDPLMKLRAAELGNWLLPSMGTLEGFPNRFYRIGENPAGKPQGKTILAEVGSLSLEFTRLSQITGDPIYYEAISRITDTFDNWKVDSRIPGLFPVEINFGRKTLDGRYTFGGQADSYYEYLIKEHQLLQGANPQYEKMYKQAINSCHRYLIRPISSLTGLPGMIIIGDLHWNENVNGQMYSWNSNRLDHLTCFAGGMLSLGAKLLSRPKDLIAGVELTESCVWTYSSTRTGLAPETMTLYNLNDPGRYESYTFPDGTKGRRIKGDPVGVQASSNNHIQRPETIESVWYQYRITGDRRYQDQGWTMFVSWVEATIVSGGFTHIPDVNAKTPTHDDSGIESFVYAETLKYYYLLFSPDGFMSLDDWVFTTEAHPFRIPKSSVKDSSPLWVDRPKLILLEHEVLGEGTEIQKWSRLMQSAAGKGWKFSRLEE